VISVLPTGTSQLRSESNQERQTLAGCALDLRHFEGGGEVTGGPSQPVQSRSVTDTVATRVRSGCVLQNCDPSAEWTRTDEAFSAAAVTAAGRRQDSERIAGQAADGQRTLWGSAAALSGQWWI
jgi:hypothetical protein